MLRRMKYLRKFSLSTFLALLLAAVLILPEVSSGQDRPGSSDADFLRIGISPRAAGLGDAFISLVEGAEATYYNPAALVNANKINDVTLNHTFWFAGINHDFISYNRRVGNNAFAVSATALYTDEMEVRTPMRPGGTGETFVSTNLRTTLSYARRLTRQVSFGMNANYINLALYDNFVAHGFSTDIAILYDTHIRGFKFAFMMKNLGTEMEFVEEAYPLPVSFHFGGSFNVVETEQHVVTIVSEGLKPNDGPPLGQGGIEYSFSQLFFVRGGLKFETADAFGPRTSVRYAGGFGLRDEILNTDFRFDYGFSDYGDLGYVHRIGVGFGI